MAGLSEEDFRRIEEMLARAMAAAVKNHPCRFSTVLDADAPEMGHAVGMLADIGKGEVRTGIETIRENHKWVSRVRDRADQAGVAAAIGVIGIFITGMATALWVGFKSSLK